MNVSPRYTYLVYNMDIDAKRSEKQWRKYNVSLCGAYWLCASFVSLFIPKHYPLVEIRCVYVSGCLCGCVSKVFYVAISIQRKSSSGKMHLW